MAAVPVQIRRGTAAQWTSANPTLLSGEQGFETDTKRRKTGDGTTAWNSLVYEPDPTSFGTVRLADISGTSQLVLQLHGAPPAPPDPIAKIQAPITYYVDPTYSGGSNDGSQAHPYTTLLSTNTKSYGSKILLRAGTTCTLTSLLQLIPSSNGLSPSRTNGFIIGVYDPVTFEEISGNGQGLATVNVNNTATVGVYWDSQDYIRIDGLKFINANGTGNSALVLAMGTSANCQVLNCDASNGTANGIMFAGSGLGNVVDNNRARGNANSGVYVLPSADSDLRITFNDVGGNVGHGIVVYQQGFSLTGSISGNTLTVTATSGALAVGQDIGTNGGNRIIPGTKIIALGSGSGGTGTYNINIPQSVSSTSISAIAGVKYTGVIAGNTGDGYTGSSDAYGVFVQASGGKSRIYLNDMSGYAAGVNFVGSVSIPDFTGTVVEWNELSRNQFGFTTNNSRGQIIVQLNRIAESGSKNGGTSAITSIAYGRAIELYGSSVDTGTRDVIVRWNWIYKSYCFHTDGTEGVGVGFDNNSYNCHAYGNYIALCEGHGFEANVNAGQCSFTGNIVVDCMTAPTGRGISVNEDGKTQCVVYQSPGTRVDNNTIVSTGRTLQKYGVSLSSGSSGSKARNNHSIGATTAAMFLYDPTNATVSNTIAEGSPNVAVNASGTSVSAGSGSSAIASGASGCVGPFYVPPAGGVNDATGVVIDPRYQSFRGRLLSRRTPIGALHAAETFA